MPGPPPTPTNVLDHRGSWRAKTRPKEPRPKLAKPRAPAYLSDGAKAVWRRVTKDLLEMKVLAKADQDIVAIYCQAVADVARLTRFLAENGETFETDKGYVGRRPETVMLREARETVIKVSKHLGLSPAYRAKVQVIDEPEEPESKGRFFA